MATISFRALTSLPGSATADEIVFIKGAGDSGFKLHVAANGGTYVPLQIDWSNISNKLIKIENGELRPVGSEPISSRNNNIDGYILLSATTGLVGYVQFYKGNNDRIGYIGYYNDRMAYVSDSYSYYHNFKGAPLKIDEIPDNASSYVLVADNYVVSKRYVNGLDAWTYNGVGGIFPTSVSKINIGQTSSDGDRITIRHDSSYSIPFVMRNDSATGSTYFIFREASDNVAYYELSKPVSGQYDLYIFCRNSITLRVTNPSGDAISVLTCDRDGSISLPAISRNENLSDVLAVESGTRKVKLRSIASIPTNTFLVMSSTNPSNSHNENVWRLGKLKLGDGSIGTSNYKLEVVGSALFSENVYLINNYSLVSFNSGNDAAHPISLIRIGNDDNVYIGNVDNASILSGGSTYLKSKSDIHFQINNSSKIIIQLGGIKLIDYTSLRDDSTVSFPSNFLYNTSTGVLNSAPASLVLNLSAGARRTSNLNLTDGAGDTAITTPDNNVNTSGSDYIFTSNNIVVPATNHTHIVFVTIAVVVTGGGIASPIIISKAKLNGTDHRSFTTRRTMESDLISFHFRIPASTSAQTLTITASCSLNNITVTKMEIDIIEAGK